MSTTPSSAAQPLSARLRSIPVPALGRNATIVLGVMALHVAVLWAMQVGLLRRAVEAVVPAEILVEIMAPAAALPEPKPAPQPQTKVPHKSVAPMPTLPSPQPAVTPQPAPSPLAIAPSATAPEPSAATPAAWAANAATATAGSKVNAPSAPPKVELPSSDADYLNNPKPPYPALSKRLNEQGKVVIRVWIGTDGQASQPSIASSSGYDRLDQAALNTVLKWRYVPGKRSGVAEAMWFNVPVTWLLQ